MPLFNKRDVSLYGVLAFVQVRISASDDEDKDLQIYRYARESQKEIRLLASELVRETFGNDVEVSDVQIRPGSAIVHIVLTTVGVIFMGFSRYESFIKSFDLLRRQLTNRIQHLLERTGGIPPNTTATSTWYSGEAMSQANNSLATRTSIGLNEIIVAYLILSHASLIGLMMWIVLRHIK